MTFDDAFEKVIGHEGGFVNDPRDPGGETKFGISKRAYPNLNIKNLTISDAKNIYLRDYWAKLQLDKLPEIIRFDMFDAAVNSGLSLAAKLLQRAVKVADDGVIGPGTLAAANAMKPETLDKRINGQRLLFLSDTPNWPTYGKGWVRRVANNLLAD
jgi:lysozyme family protein